MKQVMLSVFILILTMLLTLGASVSEAGGKADEKKDDTIYKVKVEVREVKNRIVEGKVRNHTIYIDQPEEFGADNTAPTPPETLAFALGSCFVSTGRLIASQRNMNLRAIEAVVESELDFATALGTGQEKRAGFTGFKIVVKIDADMSATDKKNFFEEIASRCPMCDNILNPTPVSYELAE
jgi:putative redox protein